MWFTTRPGFEAVAKGRARELPEEMVALAAELEPALQAAVLDILTNWADGVTLAQIEEALAARDIERLAALVLEVRESAAAAVRNAVMAAVAGGAGVALAHAPVLRRVDFAFDGTDPRAVEWVRGYGFGLVREMTARSREAIRAAVGTGTQAGTGPITTARVVREAIGLTARQQAAVANYRRELETWHERRGAGGFGLGNEISRRNGRQTFAVDGGTEPVDGIRERRLRDFRFDGVLARTMGQGKALPAAQINRMVAAYQRKYLRHRSETIARTETLRAMNFGAWEMWRQAIDAGRVQEGAVRRFWKVAADERLCRLCAPVPRENRAGVGFRQPFVTPRGPVMHAPMHPNCRCAVWYRTVD